MSSSNFHSLYVAPLVVGVLTALIAAVVSYSLEPRAAVPQAAPEAPGKPPADTVSHTADNAEWPKDAATSSLLKQFLADPAAALAGHQGKEVQIRAVVAMSEPAGTIELYGVKGASAVEGLYFKCSLRQKEESAGVARNQLLTLKGTVAGYTHHRKSPYIVVDDCRIVRP